MLFVSLGCSARDWAREEAKLRVVGRPAFDFEGGSEWLRPTHGVS